MNHKYFVLHVNPEPWAVGEISGRRLSPNPNLVAFQHAVKEALEDVTPLPDDFRKLVFYFWRQQARYLDVNDRIRQRNQADATNMQKGLEDALQGVLFGNDREVRDIRSVIVDQGPHVKDPGIIIRADRIYKDDFSRHVSQEIPELYRDLLVSGPAPAEGTDQWQEADDLF